MKRFDISIILSVCVLTILIVVGCAQVQQPSLDAVSYFNRGNAYWLKGQYNKAISDCNKAIELNPKLAEAYRNRWLAYLCKGQVRKARSDFNKAANLKPILGRDRVTLGFNEGSRTLKMHWDLRNGGLAYLEYDQVISDCNETIELNPTDAEAYYNRGNAYYVKGQYEQAISDFNKAIELNLRYAEAYYNRGLAWKMKGVFDQALADAKKALSLKPTYKSFQSFVAELESEIKRKK